MADKTNKKEEAVKQNKKPTSQSNDQVRCTKCNERFGSVKEFTEHNKDCGAFGFEEVFMPTKRLQKGLKSSPKKAIANEQELKTSEGTGKSAKALGKDLKPGK